jgi:hypothetical protein
MTKTHCVFLMAVSLALPACHENPAEAVIQNAVKASSSCAEMPRIISHDIRVDGDYAAGSVQVECKVMQDDGTNGASCRNAGGCYKKVSVRSRCMLRFQWKAEWVLEAHECSGALAKGGLEW